MRLFNNKIATSFAFPSCFLLLCFLIISTFIPEELSMPTYLKQASPLAKEQNAQTSEIVSRILKDIEEGGEAKALEYAARFDGHTPGSSLVLTEAEIQTKINLVPEQIKQDIQFAHGRTPRLIQFIHTFITKSAYYIPCILALWNLFKSCFPHILLSIHRKY